MGSTNVMLQLIKLDSELLKEQSSKNIAGFLATEINGSCKPLKIKQIVPINYDGSTEKLLVYQEFDKDIFDCSFYVDGEFIDDGDSTFISANQLNLIRELKELEYGGEICKVDKIVPLISDWYAPIKCNIYLKSIKNKA